MKEYDVIVIGSGPAGSMVSIYVARNNFKTAMFTGAMIGGQLAKATEVENFPAFPEPIGGLELAERIVRQSRNVGVNVISDSIEEVNFSSRPFKFRTGDKDIYCARNVVIATGAIPKWLDVEGEMKFRGFGVSTCATCDGAFFRNQSVAVVGGGETAGTEALHMAHLASKVYLVYRKDTFTKMQRTTVKKLESNEKIEIIFNSAIREICGTREPKSVEYIKIFNHRTGIANEIEVKAVFVAIGIKPLSDLFMNTGLNIDSDGYIITGYDSARTNIKNIYAVGDVTNKRYKQAVIAAGYGAIAALEIERDNQYEF